MPTMNISLPENLKAFVESQVESGDYSSVSEFMRELVRREQKNCEREKLEMRILEGLSSGDAIEVTPQMWDRLRQRLRDRGSEPDSAE
jgi:antitoxin ParD1/3/4